MSFFVAAAIFAVSCSKDKDNDSSSDTNKDNPPVGIWKVDGGNYLYKISSNGTFVAFIGWDDGRWSSYESVKSGTWALDASETSLSFTSGGTSSVYVVQSMSENTIVLLSLSSGDVMTFLKVNNDYSLNDFAGTWKCTKYITRWYSNEGLEERTGNGNSYEDYTFTSDGMCGYKQFAYIDGKLLIYSGSSCTSYIVNSLGTTMILDLFHGYTSYGNKERYTRLYYEKQ